MYTHPHLIYIARFGLWNLPQLHLHLPLPSSQDSRNIYISGGERERERDRMLLKSSSTPVLGSLLSETTPNNNHHHQHHPYEATTKHPSSSPFHCNRLSFASLNPTTSLSSCNSSPISPSITADFSDHDRLSCRGFRRAQSEGNLNTLAHVSDAIDVHEAPIFFDSYKPKKSSGRPQHLMLQTIPSFSFYDSRGRTEEEKEEEEEEEEEDTGAEENTEIWAENPREETGIKASEGGCRRKGMIFTREVTGNDETWSRTGFRQEREFVSQKMHLARGLGIDGADGIKGGGGHSGSGGGELSSGGCSGEGGDRHGIEEYYKKMVVENPGNPLVLRNYAQFLYQSKGDLRGAEEYYSRAILIDSKDGEILSQYAKLMWELHRDQERASTYFERAVQASPQDSHVHAAYANFLWETEDDDDECDVAEEIANMVPLPHFDQSYKAAATA